MNRTYQNRHTGELFKWRWENKTHVGLVSLTDQREVKVKRSNLLKSYKAADDYRHVPPAPDPPEPIGEPLPVRVGDKLPGPPPIVKGLAEMHLPPANPAPRPTTGVSTGADWLEAGYRSLIDNPDAKRAWDTFKPSEGEHPAPASSTSRDALVRGGEPPGEAKAPSSRPSEESFKGDYPWSQPIPDAPVRIVGPERFWSWPYVLAVVLSALSVVVMWIAVLS